MSRIFSLGALGSSWILVATSFSLLGDDKTAIDSGAEAKARQAIKSALQAEASGNNQRRKELLARAVSDAPQVGETNWHSGRIQTGGKWLELSSAEQQAASDSRIAEYRKLREEAADNPKLLRNLARWCIKMGWEDTARLHYAQLLKTRGADLESKQEAIKRLDLYNVDGNWVTGKELAVQRQKTKAIEDALAKWRPRVKRLQTAIDGDDFPRREHATKELEQLDDPQVIPVLESFLVDGEDRFQEAAVKRLAQFPHYEATQALAHYAVLSPFLSAREKATAALRDRSVFEYGPLLLGGLIAPLKTQFQIEAARGGRVVYRHMFQRQTPQVNQVAVADNIALPMAGLRPQHGNGPERMILGGQFMQNEVAAFQSTAAIVNQQVSAANASVDAANRRITEALQATTGEQLGNDPQRWWNWWQDYNQKQLPQVSQFAYTQQQHVYGFPLPQGQRGGSGDPASGVHHSCFVAGTPIRTQSGFVSIETIKPGDRVLSQDPDTGELAYKVVAGTTIRPPGKLLRIRVEDESLTTTPGHPFWVDGYGWRMAKELRTGDLLHSVNGAVQVDNIDELPDPQEAYNLVVDDFNSYFVGKSALLVHDNEFRRPTRAIVPGLIQEVASK